MPPLPGYPSYLKLSVYRDEVRNSGGVRGSGGVACLVCDDIFSFTSVVHSDAFARFMWVRIGRRKYRQRDIFIVVCYFPPTSSPYAIHDPKNVNPFCDLQESISQFEGLGDIIILGDFNARTRDLQTPLHDRGSNSNCTFELDPTTMGLQRTSEDVLGPLSGYLWDFSAPQRMFLDRSLVMAVISSNSMSLLGC